MLTEKSDHQRIMNAGWAYRANERGWIIYRDPQTGFWHTRAQALTMLDSSIGRENLCS